MDTSLPIRMIALLALLVLPLTACGSSESPQVTAKAINQADAGPVVGTLEFEGFESGFRPASVEVDQPGRYAVTFTNVGHSDHDWVVPEIRLLAKPGETASGEVVVPAGGLEYVCSIPGHAANGMRGTITVKGATGAHE